jgi:hypothetical protein
MSKLDETKICRKASCGCCGYGVSFGDASEQAVPKTPPAADSPYPDYRPGFGAGVGGLISYKATGAAGQGPTSFRFYSSAPGTPQKSEKNFRGQTEAEKRKAQPLARGVLDYFPDALLAVANLSHVGNEQHNPGQPLHWAKEKSTDEADALMRHLIQRGTYDTDGIRHSAKVAWRALALLQRELDILGKETVRYGSP